MTKAELAWAAGLFEGEGSIQIVKANKRNLSYLIVEIVNTDRAIIAYFEERWPGYGEAVIPPGNRRPYWRWKIAANKAASFLRQILPYFHGGRAREKALLALAFQAQKKSGTQQRNREYLLGQKSFYDQLRTLNRRGGSGQLTLLGNYNAEGRR